MTHLTVVAILQLISTLAFVAIAALSIRDWLATRERSRMYLALAVGSLAAVSLLGQLAKVLGAGFAAASGYLTIVIFLGSGLALLLFRDSVIPLSRRTRWLVIGVVGLTAIFMIAVRALYGTSAPKPLSFAELIAFIVVWSGCVGEPSIRRKDELSYYLHTRKKTSEADLKRMRQQNREMSDKEFISNYGFYDLTAQIILKFKDSKLAYLAVSKLETY